MSIESLKYSSYKNSIKDSQVKQIPVEYLIIAGGGSGGRGGNNFSGSQGTGGGGEGGSGNYGQGAPGSGGSGLVVMRYSNAYTATDSAGLTASTTTSGSDKITTFTAGTGTISFN